MTPGAPQGFKAAAVNHGANLTWSPPANASGATTYEVTWPGGSATASGRSQHVTGLANNKSYTFTVKAKNGAGEGATASASATLAPKPRTYRNTDNDDTNTFIRDSPAAGGKHIGKIPQHYYGNFSIQCQARGVHVTDEYNGRSSNIWDKITYNGVTGYVSDMYFATPNSNASEFSDPPLWGCT